MQHTLPSEDIRPISLLGNEAAQLLKDAQTNRRPIFLTNRGKAAGVLMNVEEYERLLELIRFQETILASEEEADRGEVTSHEQLKNESKKWIGMAAPRKNTKSNGRKQRSDH